MLLEQNFFKLLKYSNELKRNNKYLDKEDPEAFETLLNFLVTIEENFHYSEKQEYINLAKDFLDNKITADDFSYSFLGIYEGISKKINKMKREESLELGNFLNITNCDGLNRLLQLTYGSCDSFSTDPVSCAHESLKARDFTMSDEKELKSYAQTLLLKLQDE